MVQSPSIPVKQEDFTVVQESHNKELLGTSIVVGERPMVFWSADRAGDQQSFLGQVEPSYFQYISDTHERELGGPNDRHAAMLIRSNYSHALETLFALIAAALQAPSCPMGWMLQYKNNELERLIEAISEQKPIESRIDIKTGGWEKVAEAITPNLPEMELKGSLVSAMALLCSALSKQFLDKRMREEYNSIKHGLRLRPSDWYFALGVEGIPGMAAAPEKMRIVSRSDYGASFVSPTKLKTRQFAFERHRVNWWPGDFIKRMPVVTCGITNVLAFLKLVNGVTSSHVEVLALSKHQVEEALRSDGPAPGLILNLNTRIDVDALPVLSSADILTKYRRTKDKSPEVIAT